MDTQSELPLFSFESSDSLAQFMVWIVPVAGGGIVGLIAFQLGHFKAVAALAIACLLLIVGLRSSIVVYPKQVRVVRKWFFIPYKTYTAEHIEDISYGGDWGLEDGAFGVVVKMGGKEVHIGTSKNMRFLHDALSKVAYSGRKHGDNRGQTTFS